MSSKVNAYDQNAKKVKGGGVGSSGIFGGLASLETLSRGDQLKESPCIQGSLLFTKMEFFIKAHIGGLSFL